MIKITVEKRPISAFDENSSGLGYSGLRYSTDAEFKTSIEELSDPKSAINAMFDAMRLEGYTDYEIVRVMSEFVDENAEVLYKIDGYPYPTDSDEDEIDDEDLEDTDDAICDKLIKDIVNRLFREEDEKEED